MDIFAAIYLCSFLGHFHQGVKLVSDPRQRGLLKQTFLSLSKHHPNQHTEHGWTHVIAGSVGENLLKVVQDTLGEGVSSKSNFCSSETKITVIIDLNQICISSLFRGSIQFAGPHKMWLCQYFDLIKGTILHKCFN